MYRAHARMHNHGLAPSLVSHPFREQAPPSFSRPLTMFTRLCVHSLINAPARVHSQFYRRARARIASSRISDSVRISIELSISLSLSLSLLSLFLSLSLLLRPVNRARGGRARVQICEMEEYFTAALPPPPGAGGGLNFFGLVRKARFQTSHPAHSDCMGVVHVAREDRGPVERRAPSPPCLPGATGVPFRSALGIKKNPVAREVP